MTVPLLFQDLSDEMRFRDAIVVLPRDWFAHPEPLPVVIVLTGGGTSAGLMAELSRMHEACWSGAAEDQFVTVYPQSFSVSTGREPLRGSDFDTGFSNGDASAWAPDDVNMIADLLDALQSKLLAYLHRIDPTRTHALEPDDVYLVGFSNGGMFAYRLTSELGARGWYVRGLCVVSGAIGGVRRAGSATITAGTPVTWSPDPVTAHPNAVLLVHSLNDEVVPPGEMANELVGPNTFIYSAYIVRGLSPADAVAFSPAYWSFLTAVEIWRAHQGGFALVAPSSAEWDEGLPDGRIVLVANATVGAPLVLATVLGNWGHTWPAKPFALPSAFAKMVWRFFLDPTLFV